MSVITKENFYTAYFIDDARENIEVLLKEPNFDNGRVEVRLILFSLMKSILIVKT